MNAGFFFYYGEKEGNNNKQQEALAVCETWQITYETWQTASDLLQKPLTHGIQTWTHDEQPLTHGK